MAVATVADALSALGYPPAAPPPQGVLYGSAGTLVTLGIPESSGRVEYRGFWIDSEGPHRVGVPAPKSPFGTARGLTGPAEELGDLFVLAIRTYASRVAEIDERLSALQRKGPRSSLEETWAFQAHNAVIRLEIGRAIAALTEIAGPLGDRFPGFSQVVASVQGQLTAARESSQVSDLLVTGLIQLKSIDESNRLQAVANELSRESNRLTAIANYSNIRVLGITYIALILALVSAVVLIPNTGATILGMPSAGWVPGIWVDLILLALAAVPLYLVFSRPWVRQVLRSLRTYEARTQEGISDLPEISPEEAARGGPHRTR